MRGRVIDLLPGRLRAAVLRLRMRRSDRRAGVVLLYHVVDFRDGDPESELVPAVGERRFRRQLRHLSRSYAVVSLEELPSAVERRRRGERFPVAITFDDDAPQHVANALPALDAERLPATFFLTGAGIGDGRAESAWWERLQRVFDSGHAEQAVARLLPGQTAGADIHSIAAAIEALGGVERERLSRALLEWAGPDPPKPAVTASDIRRLRASGHSIGFHTRDHARLTELDDAELADALERGRGELEQVSGGPIAAIAYPHGHADERVASAAREAGFLIGATGARAALTRTSDRMLTGRFEPLAPRTGEPSAAAFELGLAQTLLIE